MIALERVTKRFGDQTVVDELSLEIAAGELCALVGPSGAGKSTVLRMVNQLIPQSAGTIRIAGRDVTEIPAEELRRRIGYVIQSVGLFPHWTIERNIATVPRLLGWSTARIERRIAELMAMLRLDEALRRRYPHQLSGGQQQRVGVARALAADPDLLLMDEPFGAVDPTTRIALQAEIARIHRESGKTILMVSHDVDGALRLASRIAILDRGRLVQAGRPIDIIRAPADDFVRSFLGREDLGVVGLIVEEVATRFRRGENVSAPTIAASASLRQALSQMITLATDRLSVVDDEGRPLGALHLADLIGR